MDFILFWVKNYSFLKHYCTKYMSVFLVQEHHSFSSEILMRKNNSHLKLDQHNISFQIYISALCH